MDEPCFLSSVVLVPANVLASWSMSTQDVVFVFESSPWERLRATYWENFLLAYIHVWVIFSGGYFRRATSEFIGCWKEHGWPLQQPHQKSLPPSHSGPHFQKQKQTKKQNKKKSLYPARPMSSLMPEKWSPLKKVKKIYHNNNKKPIFITKQPTQNIAIWGY